VTGDSPLGIGLSGVSHSAFGSRLQSPAADGRKAEAWVPDARGRHPSPEIVSATGRADHPWSAAVERGRSTLPKA